MSIIADLCTSKSELAENNMHEKIFVPENIHDSIIVKIPYAEYAGWKLSTRWIISNLQSRITEYHIRL